MAQQQSIKRQNRITYIVLGNPRGASRMLRKRRVRPPRDKRTLVRYIKHLVRQEGLPAIRELLGHHPDKDVILKTSHHGGCSCPVCDPVSEPYLEETDKLAPHYGTAYSVPLNPESHYHGPDYGITPADETPLLPASTSVKTTAKEALLFALIFTAGIIVATALNPSKSNG